MIVKVSPNEDLNKDFCIIDVKDIHYLFSLLQSMGQKIISNIQLFVFTNNGGNIFP